MRKAVILFLLLFLSSCSGSAEKPANLVDKATMAKILADVAIMQNIVYAVPNSDPEAETKQILEKYGVNQKAFSDSYTYYMVNNSLASICDDAQDIVLSKDPKAKEFILKSKQQNKIQPLN